jgi:hypothetical protein
MFTALSACGGGSHGDPSVEPAQTSMFSVGGNVTGLAGNLTLRNEGGNDLAITADGPFSFTGRLATGTSYAVTVAAEPATQSCTVANGTGKVASANVTNVSVTCSAIQTSGAGALDPTFGNAGKVTTDFSGAPPK